MSQDQEFLPLEGDHDLIKTKALQYKEVAEAIARATTSLRVVADTSEMQSKAVDAVRKNAGFVADDISRAKDRYEKTADALIVYADALSKAKSAADTAITNINNAQSTLESAETAASSAKERASDPGPEQVANETVADTAADAVVTAAASLSGYEKNWRDARDEKDAAAEVAVLAIEGVVKDSPLNDGVWDNIGSAVKLVCDIAGVLAIFLSWVPVLGWVLVGLAALGAIIKVIESVSAAASGRGSWGDVVKSVVLGVISVFGGRILAQLGKLSKLKAINNLQGMRGTSATYAKLQGVPKGTAMLPGAARQAIKEMPKFRSTFNIFAGKAAGRGDSSVVAMLGQGVGNRLKFGVDANVFNIATTGLRGAISRPEAVGLAGLQLAVSANSVRGLIGMPGGLSESVSHEADRFAQAWRNSS